MAAKWIWMRRGWGLWMNEGSCFVAPVRHLDLVLSEVRIFLTIVKPLDRLLISTHPIASPHQHLVPPPPFRQDPIGLHHQ